VRRQRGPVRAGPTRETPDGTPAHRIAPPTCRGCGRSAVGPGYRSCGRVRRQTAAHDRGPLAVRAGLGDARSPRGEIGRPDGRPAAGKAAVTAAGPDGARNDGDDGVATVWAATAVAVLIGVLVAMLDLAAAVGARHRAEAAADLAALAAAGQAVRGTEAACGRAADAATGTGGRLVLCRLQGWDALVEVEVGMRLSMLGTVTVHGRARAGPIAGDPAIPAPKEPASTHPWVLITPSGRRTRTNGRIPRQCNDLQEDWRLLCTDRPRAVRSPWNGHRSATVAGMGRPAGAY